MSEKNKPYQLELSDKLTAKTQALCVGLEFGDAEILELVTPTTAELLKWWFHEDMMAARGGLNFHAGQKQAILNTIVAHEVLRCPSLVDLYRDVAPDALLTGTRLNDISQSKHNHPKYCLKMATGTGKTWVMQAVLIWQLLNKSALLAEAIEDEDLLRLFTRHFMIVAPGLIVYDRLLDAFCGKLIAGENGARDFNTSDVVKFAELFIPEQNREQVFNFVRGNVCAKEEIGLKTTGNGMIAITNWHLLAEGSEVDILEDDDNELVAMGADIDPALVVAQVLPLTPGRATGNALDVLDRRYARGNVLEFLANLPEMMVFNDEAHHIHEVKKEGETTEVEWQKSLSRIAQDKGAQFVQVDFSATPYNDVGSGKNKRKVYFSHIITDFDLKSSMGAGLVKSLVLDKRVEVGAQKLDELDFRAERDDAGKTVSLSEGQRVMLRAGLVKLKKLEKEYATLDASRYPKMLVVCEDTTVSPLVADFFVQEGLSEDEILSVDSGKKAELGAKEWEPLRERLFSVDNHATPRVVVSVLMLREGFDVNNICVIVPLRSSQAQILLEQTIGRGLRLMWRDNEYDDIKFENRALLKKGKSPKSMIDVLSIIEHPAFQSFYDELMAEGLVGVIDEDDVGGDGSTGDMIKVGLRDDYAQYDFKMPFILSEAEQFLSHSPMSLSNIPSFTAMPLEALKGLLGTGDRFHSQDLQTNTLFGDYRVNGVIMNVAGYNDYLARMGRRIAQALQIPLPKGNKIASHVAHPYLHMGNAEIIATLDEYVRYYLFSAEFEPMADENWRVLLLQPVIDHVVEKFACALMEAQEQTIVGESEVYYRSLSEVDSLVMRESFSLDAPKCIYSRLSYPSHSGGLEKAFIEASQKDSAVDAYCKINENRHTFMRLRYLKQDGLPAYYYPDFLVRVGSVVYMVETKAQAQVNHPNVQRKRQSALNWCVRINLLSEDLRENVTWQYVLLGETAFYNSRENNETLSALLNFARLVEITVNRENDSLF